MKEKPVAVLGAGNAGCCMAADLALQGYRVNLYQQSKFEEAFSCIRNSLKIEISGSGKDGIASLNKATHDIKEALDGVELINIAVPAFAQETFFMDIMPLLKDNHTVVLWAGNFGSLRLHKMIDESGSSSDALIAEVNTIPYGTRLRGPGKVSLHIVAPYFTAASLPSCRNSRLMEVLGDVFPLAREGHNVISVAMSNPNPVVHPAGVLLNTGRVEYSGGDFGLYREGITPSVGRVIKGIYEEVSLLAGALGTEIIKYRDIDFETTTSVMGVAFQAETDTAEIIAKNFLGPKSLSDRYVTEDVPYGLVPMSLLAKAYGISCPLIDAVISIASSVCGEDFMDTGRTLETLGIEGLTVEQLMKFLEEGTLPGC